MTSNAALCNYILESRLANQEDAWIWSDTPSTDMIRGRHVISSGLPLHLAAAAAKVTEIPLRPLPALDELANRGTQPSLLEIRERACKPVTYRVRIVEPAEFADPVSAACALFGEDPTEYIEPDAEFAG